MVDVHITGMHFQLSDKIRERVTEKLGGLRKFHHALSSVHVTIHPAEKHGYKVDVDMHLPQGRHVVAHDHEDSVYAAIDVVHDKCAAQLRKIHDKEIATHHVA